MDNVKLLTVLLVVIVGIIVMLLIILGLVFFYSKTKKKASETTEVKEEKKSGISKNKKFKEYKTESVMNFLEFDTVVDNMISQKNGMRYIMVVECQGINYDLMSQVEKNAVEESFVQFLNTLRYPVQIYVQTRTINLENSIQTYRSKVDEIQQEFNKIERRYEEMRRSGRYSDEMLNSQYFELIKKRNLLEYGKDIVYNTERMSMNKNVLNKKYYVIIPYFIEDLDDNKYDKLEQRSYAFSELYTRAQATIRTLSACGISGKILTSNELVELLYMAYNRDEAETYGIDKALKAGYDELYTTAPDVVEKQIKALDEEIQQQALEKAKDAVNEVKSEKMKILEEKKANKKVLVDEFAKMIIQENADSIGIDTAIDAIENIEKKEKKVKKVKGGETKEDVKNEKTKRTRKTKSA